MNTLDVETSSISLSTLSPLIDWELVETKILPHVFKPGRYLGLEQGAYRKPFEQAKATMMLAYPDLYEIGMSSYALKLLYSVVNQHPNYLCDRVYAPAQDLKDLLAKYNVPLFGLESKRPVKTFDLLAVSLQYELTYTTLLGLLASCQIPLRAVDRPTLDFPLLMGGGPGTTNPMPLLPFFDAFMIGDGEEILLEILEVIAQGKNQGVEKPEFLNHLAQIDGLYVPGKTERAYKRIVDIAQKPVDIAPLIPAVESVHDRVVVEARRGCDRMCRFCQPCFINLPVREQDIETIKKTALRELEKTGYEECSLLSLSIADYSELKPMVLEVSDALRERNASLSLPSQRADRFTLDVAEAVQSVRKSTLTFAPEAGTARLRDVINKNLTDEEILKAVTTSYRAGWNKVKLYFMIGLPTETRTDLDGIVDIVKRMKAACAAIKREPGLSIKNQLEVNLTLSNFVPKPHTPFQWSPQDTMAELQQKIDYLKSQFKGMKGIKLNFTSPSLSKLEAVVSKGGVELADVIENAYRAGAYLDAWNEMEDNFAYWFRAMKEVGLDPDIYTRDRLTDPETCLPWDPIDVGLDKGWLRREFEKSLEASSTTPCFDECSACGVCATFGTWPSFTEVLPEVQAQYAPSWVSSEKVFRSQNYAKPIQLQKMPVMQIRLNLEKRGGLKFISHLDWMRMFHRTLIRSQLPLAYTQGFNPRPKIAMGPALPMFMEGQSEWMDVFFIEPVAGSVKECLNHLLPEGGKILSEFIVPLHSPSIDQQLRALVYTASLDKTETNLKRYTERWGFHEGACAEAGSRYTIDEQIAFLMSQSELPCSVETKKGPATVDIRPYLSDFKRIGPTSLQFKVLKFHRPQEGPMAENVLLDTSATSRTPAGIKPEWVLRQLDPDLSWSVTRTALELKTGEDAPSAIVSACC